MIGKEIAHYPEAFADTQTEFDEDLIRTEAEELAENLFRTSYYDRASFGSNALKR